MQSLVHKFLDNHLSRRGFVSRMTALGFTAVAAEAGAGQRSRSGGAPQGAGLYGE